MKDLIPSWTLFSVESDFHGTHEKKSISLTTPGVVFVAVLLIVLLLVAGCTAPDDAKATLEAQGYTDVETTGYDFWACSEDDHWQTGFKAASPAGEEIEGTVCSGWMKGTTIRFK